MEATTKTFARGIICAAAVLAMTGSAAVPAAPARSVMPVAQQNAMVQKYCAVCHTDAVNNGGLSLEHFDAARPDPGLAAMMVSKLKAKALGAGGLPLPDKATQDAFQSALSASAAGAENWTVRRVQEPAAKIPVLTASIVREVRVKGVEDPDLYRLKVTCDTATHQGEIQLAWSPGVPKSGQEISVTADESAQLTYKVEGTEKMGNGSSVTSGPGAILLASKKVAIPLPRKALVVRNVFADETVVFPFDALGRPTRKALSACFAGKTGIQGRRGASMPTEN
jgi:hypothetical protein